MFVSEVGAHGGMQEASEAGGARRLVAGVGSLAQSIDGTARASMHATPLSGETHDQSVQEGSSFATGSLPRAVQRT